MLLETKGGQSTYLDLEKMSELLRDELELGRVGLRMGNTSHVQSKVETEQCGVEGWVSDNLAQPL